MLMLSQSSKPITAEKIESALKSYLADMHYSLARAMGDFGLHFVGLVYSEDF